MSTHLTPEFLASIHPEVHPRYSTNFYKWLRWFSTVGHGAPVAVYTDDSNEARNLIVGRLGEIIPMDNGESQWLDGRIIMEILRSDGKRQDSHEYFSDFTEIPKWLDNYQRIGRCLLDPKHEMQFIQTNTRWAYPTSDDERTCRWCGLEFRKETVLKLSSVWMSPSSYRALKEGEIVLETDEYFHDDLKAWVPPTNSVGQPAPDPRFTSHRQFRRLQVIEL